MKKLVILTLAIFAVSAQASATDLTRFPQWAQMAFKSGLYSNDGGSNN
jgi:hypothetical protein